MSAGYKFELETNNLTATRTTVSFNTQGDRMSEEEM